MSLLETIANQTLGEIAKHPELINVINHALASGVSGDALVALVKAELTRASDEAMRVSLALTADK